MEKPEQQRMAHDELSGVIIDHQVSFRYRRLQLMRSFQQLEESLDDFVNRVRPLAHMCDFTNEEAEERLIELIIAGTPHVDLQKKLLMRDKRLTLDEAIQMGRACEAALYEQVFAMDNLDDLQPLPITSDQHVNADNQLDKAFNGPAFYIKCTSCSELGHISKCCPYLEEDSKPSTASIDGEAALYEQVFDMDNFDDLQPLPITNDQHVNADNQLDKALNCPEFYIKCTLCSELGHVAKCCPYLKGDRKPFTTSIDEEVVKNLDGEKDPNADKTPAVSKPEKYLRKDSPITIKNEKKNAVDVRKCWRCDGYHSFTRRNDCPSFNKMCKRCSKIGHSERCCLFASNDMPSCDQITGDSRFYGRDREYDHDYFHSWSRNREFDYPYLNTQDRIHEDHYNRYIRGRFYNGPADFHPYVF